MANKIMHIPNDNVYYNQWLKRLETALNEPTNQNPPKMLSQRIRKHYYKTLGTCVKKAQCPLPSWLIL